MKQVLLHIAFFVFTANGLWAQEDTVLFSEAVVWKNIDDKHGSGTTIVIDSIKKAPFTFQHLGQLIQTYAGGFVKGYGSGQIATLSMRGTGAVHTSVFWEGINMQSASLGQVDFSTVPTWFFNEINIQKGPAVTASSSVASIGGSVHLNSNVFHDYVQAGVALGSFGNSQQYGLVASANNKWQHKVGASYQFAKNDFQLPKTNENQRHAEVSQWQVLGNHRLQLNPRNSVKIAYWFNKYDRNIPANIGQINQATLAGESYKASATWNTFRKKWQSQISSGIVLDNMVYQDPDIQLVSHTNGATFQNNWTSQGKLFTQLDWQTVVQHQYIAVASSGYDVEANQHRGYVGGSLSYGKNKHSFTTGLGAHVVNHMKVVPLPSAQYQYKSSQHWLWTAKTAKVFRLPTFNDLYWYPSGNPSLLPEEGWSSEFGVVKDINGKTNTWKFGLTGFYGRVHNWIIWLPSENDWAPENKQEVNNKGIEGSLSFLRDFGVWKVNAHLNTNYIVSTNTKSKFDYDKSVGKQLMYVPYQTSNGLLTISRKQAQVFGQVQYVGDRYVSSDNSSFLPAVTTLNTGFSYVLAPIKNHLFKISFEINNVLNQRYQLVLGRPMPGRNFLFTLIYHLNTK